MGKNRVLFRPGVNYFRVLAPEVVEAAGLDPTFEG